MSMYKPDFYSVGNSIYSYVDYTLANEQENLYLQDENYIHQTGNFCSMDTAINILKLFGNTNKDIFLKLQEIISNYNPPSYYGNITKKINDENISM